MSATITVIGAGNGGCAMAADLSLQGHRVTLYEQPDFADNLAPITYAGGIQITGVARSGFAHLDHVTTDIGEALADAEFVFLPVVANAHAALARVVAPHVVDGQIFCLTPGSAGTLVFSQVFADAGVTSDYFLAETVTLPYACRKLDGPGTINVHRVVQPKLPAGVYPACQTESVIARLQTVYPAIRPLDHVLEAALHNPNLMVHPIGTLLNVGRIEYTKGDFWLYKEGFTESVFRLMEAQDAEKCALLEALGCVPRTYHEFNEYIEGMSFAQFAGLSSKGPASVTSRYITEDVPVGLVLMESLGQSCAAPTPTTSAIIHLFGQINHVDYRAGGRTLASLGLNGLKPDEIRERLTRGT
jgi:opine dehydrogenase